MPSVWFLQVPTDLTCFLLRRFSWLLLHSQQNDNWDMRANVMEQKQYTCKHITNPCIRRRMRNRVYLPDWYDKMTKQWPNLRYDDKCKAKKKNEQQGSTYQMEMTMTKEWPILRNQDKSISQNNKQKGCGTGSTYQMEMTMWRNRPNLRNEDKSKVIKHITVQLCKKNAEQGLPTRWK